MREVVFLAGVIAEIEKEIAAYAPERGGLLVGPIGVPVVSSFVPDPEAAATSVTYSPSGRVSALAPAGALVIGLPLGLACAITLAEMAPSRARTVLKPTIELLAGVPSVVYGFIGMGFDIADEASVRAWLRSPDEPADSPLINSTPKIQ